MLPRALLITLLAIAAAPAPAGALELGVQDDAVLLERSYGDTDLALDRARDMGTDRIRVNLAWASAMPADQAQSRTRPSTVAWNFDRLQRLYDDASARGMRLQVTLTGPAPAWATSDHKVGYTRPDARGFGEFAAAAAAEFAGRIDRWSIWNEPNWFRFLVPSGSAPGIYRNLYRRAYTEIKAVSASNRVLIGELMPGANVSRSTPALAFLRKLTCSRSDYRAARKCAPLVADGFAIHPYNFATRPKHAKRANRDIVEMGSLSRLTGALDALRRRGALRTPSNSAMPVYLTEFGYFTVGPVAQSASTQARWLTEAWQIAARNKRVRQLLQYGLIDPWNDVTWRTAVLDRQGKPRPAYYALARLAR